MIEQVFLYLIIFLLGIIIGGAGVLSIVASRPRLF